MRSYRWLGRDDLRSFGHRSRLRQIGYDRADWVGKPVIGILNTWSDINACHGHLRERAEDVKRGVWQAGGFPIELPAMSLAEPFVKPSTMLYRNFLAMECEELLRSHPIDGAVLMGGCDKTTPGLIMGAISMGLPAIYVPAGPMLRGNWRGHTLGSGSDVWKYWDEKRAGNIGEREWNEIEGGIARSFGTCMVMGTAATMMAITEALGLSLPGASSIPAPDANHPRMCAAAGRRIVDMVWEDLTPEQDSDAGGVRQRHPRAHGARRLDQRHHPRHRHGAPRRHRARHAAFRRDLAASAGDRQHHAVRQISDGGFFLCRRLARADGRDAQTCSTCPASPSPAARSATISPAARCICPTSSIRCRRRSIREGATAVLTGNLAPRGCVMKPAAADQRFLQHRGKAIAFENYDADGARGRARRSRRHARPCSGAQERRPEGRPRHAGMGHAADPEETSQSRRARHGAHFGCAHERHELRRLHPARGAGEFCRRPARFGADRRRDRDRRRRAENPSARRRRRAGAPAAPRGKPPPPHYARGYGAMYSQHIGQADEGCDFDFLEGTAPIAEPEIH